MIAACLCLTLLVAFAAPLVAQDAPPLAIKEWVMSRARQTREGFSVVEASFRLQNTSTQALTDIQLVITYKNSVGEILKEAKPLVLAQLAPGEAAPVKLTAPAVTTFDYFELTANFKRAGKPARLLWQSSGGKNSPELRVERLLADVADVRVLGHRLGSPEHGQAMGKVRLKNFGMLPASNLVLTVKFFATDDTTAPPVGEWTGGIGDGRIGPGEERTFQFVATFAPATYSRASFTVAFETGDPLTATPPVVTEAHPTSPPPAAAETKPAEGLMLDGGVFTRAAAVEVAHWEFTPSSSYWIVRGKIRNGLRDTVRDVKIHLSLTRSANGAAPAAVYRETIALPDPIVAGERQSFETRIIAPPSFDGYTAQVTFTRVQ